MKLIVIALFLLLSSSCSTTTKIISEPVERLQLKAPDPRPIKLNSMKFIVVTEDNIDEVFAELKAQGKKPVLFAMDGDNYKFLALNMNEIKRYIIEHGLVLKLYREYYEK